MSAASWPPVALTLALVHLVECPDGEGAEGHSAATDGDMVSLFFPLAGGNCRLLRTQAAPSTRCQRWRRNEQQKHRQHHRVQSRHPHRPLWPPPAGGHLSAESVAQGAEVFGLGAHFSYTEARNPGAGPVRFLLGGRIALLDSGKNLGGKRKGSELRSAQASGTDPASGSFDRLWRLPASP